MIVLVGFMGAGKTTVGRLLAERLGVNFVDTDQLIEQRLGRTVRSIFEVEGEAHFRELEHRTVAELVDNATAIIALGGGAVTDARSRELLQMAPVVYLQVDYGEALDRVGGDQGRPMLHRSGLDDLYEQRLSMYAEIATVTVRTNGRSPEQVVGAILDALPQQGETLTDGD